METSIEQKHLRASSSTIDTTDLESRLENLNRELESNPCESPAIQCEREILENILEINKCLLYISVVHISIYAVISKDKLNHYSKILTSMVETHYIQMQKLKDEYTATYNKLSEVINSCIDHVISTAEAYRMNPEDFILKNIVSDFVSSAPFEQTQYDQLWENGDYEGLIAYIKDVFEQHDKILLKVRHLPYCLQQLSNFRDQYMGDFNLRSQLKLHELHASLFELEDLKDKIYISQVSNHSYYINKFNELLEMVKLRAKFLNQLTLGLGTAMAYIDIQFNPIKLEIFEAKKPVASLLKDNYSTGILDSGHKKFVRDLKTEFVKYDQGIDIILKKINFGIKNYRSIALVSMLNAIKASLLQVMYADLHQEYTGTFSDLHDHKLIAIQNINKN